MPPFFSSRFSRRPAADNAAGGSESDANTDTNTTGNNNNNNQSSDDDGNKTTTTTIGTKIRTFLLLHVLTALLPPTESKEELKSTEYYKVLGLKKSNNVTPEQIRKAYKQKSLALHPDKIAQRRNIRNQQQQQNNGTDSSSADNNNNNDLTEQEAAELFLKVQEAHAVLSDEHNRQVYHEMGCSPARYKFVHDTEDGGASAALSHPVLLYENLANASCMDKTRLVSVVTVFVLMLLVQPILICAKINQDLKQTGSDGSTGSGLQNVSWSVILIPFWIFYGIFFLSIQLLLVCWIRTWQVRWFALQHVCWLIGIILVVQVWDGNRIATSWHALSTPFYLAIFCRVAGMAQTASDLLHMVHSRMASLEHLQQTEPRPVRNNNNNNNNDTADNNNVNTDDDDDDDFLTEEEWIAQLAEKYVIVTPDPQIVEAHVVLWHEEHDDDHQDGGGDGGEIPEDDLETIRIASSLEYQSAMEQVQMLQRAAGSFLVYGILMVALIAAKLTPSQLATRASWWAIFTPLWIYLALQMMQALALCCCSGLAAGSDEGVIILASAAAAAAAAGTAAGEDADEMENQQQGNAASAAATTPQQVSASKNSSPNNNDRFQDEHGQKQSHQRPASSVNWANAEGSMNLPAASKYFPEPTAAAAAAAPPPTQTNDDDASLTPSDEGYFGQKRTADPPGMTAEEVQHQQEQQENNNKDAPPTASTASNGQGSGSGSGNPPSHGEQGRHDDGDEDADGMPPHHGFDEETFHRWQQAHAAAESSAMEAQAKGQWQCCIAIFQLIILCLIAGKLQDDYRPQDQQQEPSPQAVGYNAFWILFPIFFLAGILLCCCSCLIYSAGSASGLDDLVERTKAQGDAAENNDNDNNANQNDGDTPAETANNSSTAIPLAAPSTPATATTSATTTQGERQARPAASKQQRPPVTSATNPTPATTTTAAATPGMGSGGGDIELGVSARSITGDGMDDLD